MLKLGLISTNYIELYSDLFFFLLLLFSSTNILHAYNGIIDGNFLKLIVVYIIIIIMITYLLILYIVFRIEKCAIIFKLHTF